MFSNCLIESIKAKIKNKDVKIFLLPSDINNGFHHFFWSDNENIYHFTSKNIHKCQLFFNGEIKTYNKRAFEGLVLTKMFKANYSIKKAVKTALKLGLSTNTKIAMNEVYKHKIEDSQR